MAKIDQFNNGDSGASVRSKILEALKSVEVDGITITGSGTAADPLVVPQLSSSVDKIDFTPQATLLQHQEGRIQYDNNTKSFVLMNDISDVALNLGEETWYPVYNDNAFTLENGKVGYVRGASANGKVLCGLADATDINLSERTLGLFTNTIASTESGYITRFGAIKGIDTSMFPSNTLLYVDPDNPGELTSVKPAAPNYSVRIGIVLISDPVNGVLGVDTLSFSGSDTSVNIDGTLNGVVLEQQQVDFYESGGSIFVEVRNQRDLTKNLNFILGGKRYSLDTTTGPGPNGGASAQLTVGADSTTLFENYIYVWLNNGVPMLKASTLATSDTLAPIGIASLFDYARTISEGVFKFRRTNDAPNNGDDDGFNRWIADAIRTKLGTSYISGIDATVTVNSTPTITVETTAGVAMQAHSQGFQLQNGTKYWVYNNSVNSVVYEQVSNLSTITLTANGSSLAVNGAYYRLKVYGMKNSGSGGAVITEDRLIATRPIDYYTTSAEAVADSNNYDIVINDIATEDLIFPLYTLVISRTGGGGSTWALVEVQDNRSRLIGGAGGGGASSGGGTDDKVRVTANDTTNSYLNDKITAGGYLSKSTVSPAGNEQLRLDVVPEFLDLDFAIANIFKASFATNNLTGNRVFLFPNKSGVIEVISSGSLPITNNTSGSIIIGDTVTYEVIKFLYKFKRGGLLYTQEITIVYDGITLHQNNGEITPYIVGDPLLGLTLTKAINGINIEIAYALSDNVNDGILTYEIKKL